MMHGRKNIKLNKTVVTTMKRVDGGGRHSQNLV